MKTFLRTAVSVVTLITAQLSNAVTLTPDFDTRGFIYIKLDGQIEPNDPVLLQKTLEYAKAKNLKVWGLLLNSLGGSVDAGLQLASIIRQSQLATFVTGNDTCASACFYLFAAGVNRWAENGARVGVHSAAENGQETDRATAATIRFSRVLATLDVPDSILGKIVRTPPKDTYFLTQQDLASMGVQFIATPAHQIQNLLTEAGLSKQTIRDTPQDKRRARELNKSGLDAIRSSHFDDAIRSLTQAATLSPFDAEVLGNLGYAQYLQGSHEAALGTLLTALKIQPGRAMTLQNIGLVYAELGNLELASQYLASYVKTFKNTRLAIEGLQKWGIDQTQPRRARASLQALELLRITSM
ncbi:tetratricopeptide repeat protein [Curvibacter sp. CHRR-16]|uniref:tetratricopeptide repeat protein n=1 Tax=Curvibacter sp. CHRR-16 TaxID=2835872 RepID=UPI001BDA64DC|nr:tetratricopeptide repeat protein [Curvibacter sp. CHRR-16]MBT0569193.1 tetratricopeptide repeat protein [Curvibacter sp. CHRR-16]